jgi:hypothetical protein
MSMKTNSFQRGQHRRRAVSLAEVLIALLLASIMVTGALQLLQFNQIYQMKEEMRASAVDALSHEMEILKHEFIYNLEPYSKGVTLYDNRTPNDRTDDTTGTLRVRFLDRSGSVLGTAADILSTARTEGRVEVNMRVTWSGRGRFSGVFYHERMGGYVIP